MEVACFEQILGFWSNLQSVAGSFYPHWTKLAFLLFSVLLSSILLGSRKALEPQRLNSILTKLVRVILLWYEIIFEVNSRILVQCAIGSGRFLPPLHCTGILALLSLVVVRPSW